jgi:hypothetical protein
MDGRVSRNPYPPIQYVKGLPITRTFHVLTIANKMDPNAMDNDSKVAPLFRELFRVRTVALFPPFSQSQQIQDYVQTVFPDAQLLSTEKEILVYNLPEQEISSYSLSIKDPAILFFLLENWQIEHRTFRVVCRTDQAKLLLPDVKSDELLHLKLMLRGSKMKTGEMNLKMQVGDRFISSNSLKPNFRSWQLEIPGDVVTRHGRVAQININKSYADSIAELQSISVEISHK